MEPGAFQSRSRDRVFISYRRSDASGFTTAIRIDLIRRFGETAVFHDVTGIDPGAQYPHVLREELHRAAVVLAVIGRDWLSAANEYHQRRIDFEDDWVNIELSTALTDPNVTVIPVLVDGAKMPPPGSTSSPTQEACHTHCGVPNL